MKNINESFYPEDPSAIKEIGRYTAATLEYSSLFLLGAVSRGTRSISGGVECLTAPYKKATCILEKSVGPLKGLGKNAKKILSPFSWTAKKVADAGERGIPVHLDKKTLNALQSSLRRIEERLANIENNGLSVASSGHPSASDFKEKPSKEKNMLLRAILEDSKHTLEDK